MLRIDQWLYSIFQSFLDSLTSARLRPPTEAHITAMAATDFETNYDPSVNMNGNVDLRDAAELQDFSQSVDILETATEQQEPGEAARQSLLPYDGGTAAWRMLISAFVFKALLWGMCIPPLPHYNPPPSNYC